MGPASTDRLVLRQPRWRLGLGCFLAAFCMLGGVVLAADGYTNGFESGYQVFLIHAWIAASAVGLGCQVSCFLHPVEVHLDSDGFQILGFLVVPKVRWLDIERIFLVKMRGNTVVWFTLRMPAARLMPLGGRLPGQMAFSDRKLLALMKDWHGRFGHPDSLSTGPQASSLGDCTAPAAVARGEAAVVYAYREAPHSDFDSGWRLFASGPEEAFLDNAEDRVVADLGHVCDHDSALRALIEAPVGSAFERPGAADPFLPVAERSAA